MQRGPGDWASPRLPACSAQKASGCALGRGHRLLLIAPRKRPMIAENEKAISDQSSAFFRIQKLLVNLRSIAGNRRPVLRAPQTTHGHESWLNCQNAVRLVWVLSCLSVLRRAIPATDADFLADLWHLTKALGPLPAVRQFGGAPQSRADPVAPPASLVVLWPPPPQCVTLLWSWSKVDLSNQYRI